MKKIVLTGGHAATVALAVLEELEKRDFGSQIYWIGSKSAMEDKIVETAAEKIFRTKAVEVRKITVGRLKKKGSLAKKLLAFVKVPWGFWQAFGLLREIRPDVILSLGGYAAFPVVLAGWLLGVKVIIHEQIVGAGLANRLSAPFATKIAVGRTAAGKFFPSKKVVVTGNPQIAAMFEIIPKRQMSKPPVVFVTGGSSGSQIVNQAVGSVIRRLLEDFVVIHQVGAVNLGWAKEVRNTLSADEKSRYRIFGYKSPQKVVDVFRRADIVVGRAGANTVADIVTSRRPTVLIPIPWSISDEQNANAQVACKLGIARILPQSELSGERILAEINMIKNNWGKMVKEAKRGDYELDKGAAARVVDLLV